MRLINGIDFDSYLELIMGLIATSIFLSYYAWTRRSNRVIRFNGRPVGRAIQIIAHRGGCGLFFENTEFSYQGVLPIGVDYVDMDVCMAKDALVVTHDPELNPWLTRGLKGDWVDTKIPIYRLTLQELQQYSVGMIKPKTAYSAFFPHQQSAIFSVIFAASF